MTSLTPEALRDLCGQIEALGRKTGHPVCAEAAAAIAGLVEERDEALMLSEGCTTLKQMALGCFRGAQAEVRTEQAEAKLRKIETAWTAYEVVQIIPDYSSAYKALRAAIARTSPAGEKPSDRET